MFIIFHFSSGPFKMINKQTQLLILVRYYQMLKLTHAIEVLLIVSSC